MRGRAEIELKARAANPERCGQKLIVLAGEGAPFSKDDNYWVLPAALQKARKSSFSGLRVRREKKGTAEYTLVTRKIKKKRGRIEVNEEHEFEVSNALEFEELLVHLGFEKQTVKRKEGRFWRFDGVTAELCEVSGFVKNGLRGKEKKLGWFLELEILSAGSGKAAVIAAREKLLSLLEKAGLREEDLESRYYAELLTIP